VKHLAVSIALILSTIDAKHVEHTINTLVSFGTRNTLSSQSDPKRGIGAARDWIYSELEKIAATSGGRMTVEKQTFVQEPGRYPRIAKATTLTNVVATLRGTKSPDRIYVVSGHYDSMCTSPTDADCDAPGADDDASGVAVVLEAARAMAPHPFDATVIFVAVAGEEQGLVGSTYFAEQAKKNGMDIEAMFTNDIVGHGTDTVRVFGGDTDSDSRILSRFIDAAARKHTPKFHVWLIDRKDRFLRGGDHFPFLEQGYPAVRFTEPHENFDHQHQNVRVEDGKQYGDLPKFDTFSYIANVARVNTAALAELALAPARPKNVHVLTTRLTNDTDLTWDVSDDADHYEIVWRDTTAVTWQHVVNAGHAGKYTVKESKDNYIFGVRAVSRDGHRSPAVYPTPEGRKAAPHAALGDELRAMAKEDQEVRKRWIKDQQNETLKSEMAAIDAKHVARLREIVKENGWPGTALVGFNGMNDAWLIAQHGGKEFLHEMLPLMKAAVEKHDLDASLYATSVDRVRIQDGQKQLYGSQFDTKNGKCEPQPIEDAEHVEERRRAMGLTPLADYAKELCAMYKP